MTEREHFVPRFYLKHFINNKSQISVYDFEKKCFFPGSPNTMLFENNLYETPFENANEKLGQFVSQNNIENIFEKEESKFAKLLKDIVNRCSNPQNAAALILSSSEKDLLCALAINFLLRNPKNMESLRLNNLDADFLSGDFYTALKELLEKMNIGGAESICKAAQKKAMLTYEFDGAFPNKLVKSIRKLNFTFYYAKENEFISSDMPVCFGTDNAIVGDDKTCLYLALSPRVAVLFGNYKNSRMHRNRVIEISESTVDNLNFEMIRKKYYTRFIFARDIEVLRNVLKREI